MNISAQKMLNGVRIFIVPPSKSQRVEKRTWRQRLFTLPFRPFVKSVTIDLLCDFLDDGQVVRNKEGVYMNAKTFNDLKNTVDSNAPL